MAHSGQSEIMDEQLDRQAKAAVDKARHSFNMGKVKTYEQRLFYLRQLRKFVIEETEAITQAAMADVNRCRNENSLTVTVAMLTEINNAIRKLADWMEPGPEHPNLVCIFDTLEVQSQPLGVVAIFGPWNYPLTLIVRPLVGVISAGNTAVLKPSEVAPAMERIVSEKLPLYLDPDCFPVVTGGAPVATALLKQRFDHICFTGSAAIGRIVMRAAAEHLTPCTLELGGKNPLIVDDSVDLKMVAQRIMYAKSLNAGQICLNIDYIICARALQRPLVQELRKAIRLMHGEDMKESKNYCRIVNERNYDRLSGMLERTKGTVAIEGGMDKDSLFMGITVVTDVAADDSLMQDEIFGPILPILPVETMTNVVSYLNKREKPLALYIFSKRKSNIDLITHNTSSGAVLVNDAIIHYMCVNTPFGGVGQSGTGCYVGKAGFDNFSHRRAFMHHPAGLEILYEWYVALV
eukprot:scpid61011/ scgid1734/ Aldehyde dehydrogenase, dimeric NADP-preferring; Aldehyde dehydrogenase family 3 member A1; HTC-ALDH; Tumor-associated aldehyde dehydrogenase